MDQSYWADVLHMLSTLTAEQKLGFILYLKKLKQDADDELKRESDCHACKTA